MAIQKIIRLIKENKYLALILGFAILIRVAAIGYGLPLHVFSDEEAEVYGALQMLQLKTLVPALHVAQFKELLYYPPFLCYTYLLLFIPSIAGLALFFKFPALAALKVYLIIHPSIFFIVARLFGVLCSGGNSVLAYLIIKRCFRSRGIALAAAAFFAFSFIDVTVSVTARHWEPSLFASLLSVWFVLKSLDPGKQKVYGLLAGLCLGVSFGISYLVFFFPVAAGLYLFFYKSDRDAVWRSAMYFLIAFGVIACTAIALYPTPFLQQVVFHTYAPPHTTKSIVRSFVFYSRALWYFEPLLSIFFIVGLGTLFAKKKKIFFMAVAYVLLALVITYKFLWDIPRYLVPHLPFFATVAGFGFIQFLSGLDRVKRWLSWSAGLLTLGYFFALFVRLDYLMLVSDTRVSALRWIENNVSTSSPIIISSERLRVVPTHSAAAAVQALDPSALRGAEKLAASFSVLKSVTPEVQMNAQNLYYLTDPGAKRKLIKSARESGEPAYLIVDSWLQPDPVLDPFTRKNTIKEFVGSDVAAGTESPDGKGTLFIGGDSHTISRSILPLLFSIKQFGPTVTIYSL